MKFIINKKPAVTYSCTTVGGDILLDNIRVVWSGSGLRIFWKNNELTRQPGLTCAINTLGFWTDSSKADWECIERKKNYLKFKVSFKDLPLNQIWFIKILNEQQIYWSIDMEAEECMYIEEFHFMFPVTLSYKTWVSGYQQGDFPRLDDQWHHLYLKNQAADLVGVRFPVRNESLPCIFMEVAYKKEDFYPLVASPPSSFPAHFIGFRRLVSEKEREKLTSLHHLFSCTLNILDKDNVLDSRIEDLRQQKLKNVLSAEKNMLSRATNAMQDILSDKIVDILLIQCPPWDAEMPPLSIAYLSSYLKKYGFSVSVFDLNIDLYSDVSGDKKFLWEQKSYDWWVDDELFKGTWLSLEERTSIALEEILGKIQPRNIGISVSYASYHFASELLKIIKRFNNEAKIILGGWGCIVEGARNMFPKELADVFVVGEGEETLKEVLETFQLKNVIKNVPGAIFNKNCPVTFESRSPIMDLDSIPWPLFKEFDLNQYKYRAIPLFTSRGCIGHCAFCNDWALTKPYRYRSAHHVFEEIKYHVENNYIEVFSFKDLLCNGNIERLNSLCDLIIDSGIKIHWSSQAIPLKEMDKELLKKMKKSGCASLTYGIESFSNHILKLMRKMFTKETVEKVLRDTYESGIEPLINIIVGFPGETDDDFEETCEAIKRNRKYISQISSIAVCLINNDSDLNDNFAKYGLILSLDGKTRAKKWHTADGSNTYEIRRERAIRLLELIKQLKLSYVTITY